jgi:hypothetical protein
MKRVPYATAKRTITAICKAAENGEFKTRETFYEVLEKNPNIAAQGYNAFGKIFFWNKASAQAYNYSESAAVNQDLIELILPPEMHVFARDMISSARKTGKMPEAGPCDLIRKGGEYISVYSGHLVFFWDSPTSPEYYCIDLPVESDD